MKNTILLFQIIFILLLAGCKKESESKPDSPEELIKGQWLNTTYRQVEYEDGKKVDEETRKDNLLIEFDGQKASYTDSGIKTTAPYRIYASGNKTLIEFTNPTGKDDFEIESISKTAMVWTYTDEQHVGNKHMKVIVHQDFIKQ